MKAKEIIALNNEKRKQLTIENEAYYEDMLLYIRLSSTKSEQQTEEILLELLEHTLGAQEAGKTVKDVFGDDLKAYCQEVIEEIPQETKKKQFKFVLQIMCLFLAITSFFNGIVGTGLYYFFTIGSPTTTFSLGSSVVIIVIDLIILWVFITFIMKWIKSSLFKEKVNKTSKWLDFIKLWLFSCFWIILFILVHRFTPSFGPPLSIPTIALAGIGIVLYGISYVLKDKK